jgi:hypothetical protein
MNRLAIALGALLIAFCGMDGAKAQTQTQPFYGVVSPTGAKGMQGVDYLHGLPIGAKAVAACGGQSLTAGIIYPVSQDLTGTLCSPSGGGGGATAVTVANGADVALGNTTDSPAATPTTTTAATAIALLKALNNSNIASVPAGTNVIGGVNQGTSPWVVSNSGTFAVQAAQSTAANLNATVVGTGTFATQATLAAETTKVIGTVNQGTSPWVVSGTVTAGGFAPGGTFATLTATGSSASVALPAGSTVAFQNTGTTAVSCTLGVGSATAVASEIVIQASSTVFVTVGSNTFGACIDQTGSVSNLVVLAGGAGLGTGFGGGGGGGGTTTVIQPTASLLNATVVGTGTFATQATLAAETTKVIGTVNQGTSPWVDNVSQFGGTNISTGTGASGAGIPRVTISNDSTLAANQSVNVAQFGGVSTSTGQVAVSVAPVTATNTALVVDLRPDSPGIVALGQTIKSASVPVAIASDQLGTNTAANSLPVVLSTTPTIANGSGVVNAPSSETLAALTPVVSSALESNHVIKASAGNFYAGYVTTGATGGWLLLANSTTAPTAGGAAIAPIACVVAPANATTSIGNQIPIRASTGITLVFSTSGCLTNTASATAYFSGMAN